MNTCPNCFGKQINDILHRQEYIVDGKQITINNIPTIQCYECHEIYYGPEGMRYVDEQIDLVCPKK